MHFLSFTILVNKGASGRHLLPNHQNRYNAHLASEMILQWVETALVLKQDPAVSCSILQLKLITSEGIMAAAEQCWVGLMKYSHLHQHLALSWKSKETTKQAALYGLGFTNCAKYKQRNAVWRACRAKTESVWLMSILYPQDDIMTIVYRYSDMISNEWCKEHKKISYCQFWGWIKQDNFFGCEKTKMGSMQNNFLRLTQKDIHQV